jgi:hypothetical protein
MLRQSLRIFATCEVFEIKENLATIIVRRRYEQFYFYDSFEILTPDWKDVLSQMDETYALQRKYINFGDSYVTELRGKWPYNIEERVLLQHAKTLLGIDLLKAIEEGFSDKGPRMLKLFKTRINLLPLINATEHEKKMDNWQAIFQMIILCLQTCLGRGKTAF